MWIATAIAASASGFGVCDLIKSVCVIDYLGLILGAFLVCYWLITGSWCLVRFGCLTSILALSNNTGFPLFYTRKISLHEGAKTQAFRIGALVVALYSTIQVALESEG